jgi:hypothetical protein
MALPDSEIIDLFRETTRLQGDTLKLLGESTTAVLQALQALDAQQSIIMGEVAILAAAREGVTLQEVATRMVQRREILLAHYAKEEAAHAPTDATAAS